MKLLRDTIRKLILEDYKSFVKDLMGNPNWDEGAGKHFPTEQEREAVYPDGRKRGRLAKQIWAKHVDREYINSLVYIHWGSRSSAYKLIVDNYGKGKNKDEIACSGYERGLVGNRNFIGRYGVVIKGHVSLFANEMDNVMSGRLSSMQKYNPEMGNTSGYNRGVQIANAETYILDQDSFLDRRDPHVNQSEAFLDNWQIEALVFEPHKKHSKNQDEQNLIKELRRKEINIPIFLPRDL